MKNFRAGLFALSAVMTLVIAISAPAAEPDRKEPKSEAQIAYAAFMKQAMQQPPAKLSEREAGVWDQTQYARVCDEAMAFIERFPNDPLRWHAADIYVMYARNLEKDARTRRKRADELISQGLRSTDIADGDWQQMKSYQISRLIVPALEAVEANQPADLVPIRRALDELTQRFPDSQYALALELQYVELLTAQTPTLARAWLEQLADSGNKEMARLAAGQLRTLKLHQEPLAMKFTALDGREVDLANLRGKVVLIDFWATWCGPCVAEIPNIKAVYDQYHERGFEVVGITLDGPGDAKKVRDFVAGRALPWPQFFDAKNEKNSVAEEYGIYKIPTQFLLDKEGRLVNDKARGEVLRTEVSRLLGG